MQTAGEASLFEHHLRRFIRESNAIEGIHRDIREAEITYLASFLSIDTISLKPVQVFTMAAAGAELREKRGMDVRVGPHVPIPGGPAVKKGLIDLLKRANDPREEPFRIHCEYETLHPFMDGNGRSGRAVWGWMMWKRGYRMERAFLHEFYYQTLDQHDSR